MADDVLVGHADAAVQLDRLRADEAPAAPDQRLGEHQLAPSSRAIGVVQAAQRVLQHRTRLRHSDRHVRHAVAHAARGIAARQVDAEVPCVDPAQPRDAVLWIDGRETLRWTLLRNTITAPALFAGQDLGRMMPWAKLRFIDRDSLEAVLMLRRAVFVSGNRFYDLDRMASADDTGHVLDACYVYREGVASRAVRVQGATLDFSGRPELLLADLPGVCPESVGFDLDRRQG